MSRFDTVSLCRSPLLVLCVTIGAATATGCGPGVATADAFEGAEASGSLAVVGAPRPASFLTFNMCGSVTSKYCREPHVPALVDFIVKNRPTAFALQEVCGYQADLISKMLRERGVNYVQRYRNLSVLGTAPFCGTSLNDRRKGDGIALFHEGTTLGEIREGTFKTLSCADYLPFEFPFCRLQPRGYVCAKVPDVQLWACATHIEVKPRVEKAQIDELAEVTQALNSPAADGRRPPVVVGGDFNVTPAQDPGSGAHPLNQAHPLNAMLDKATYSFGTGAFFEHDVRGDRTYPPEAATQGAKKLDYIFHSRNVSVEKSSVSPGVNSDHAMLFNTLLLPAVGGD